MKEHKAIIEILKQNLKFKEMLERLLTAYNVSRTDEEMLGEVEEVLYIYRELKKESEGEK